jgi:hypothetical protein
MEKLRFLFTFILLLYRIKRRSKFAIHLVNQDIIKINKKKNLFFKKRFGNKILVSKRLTIVCRKKKIQTKLKHSKFRQDTGNFFFKKFFFKTLLKSRKLLKPFLFLGNKSRQKKLTKEICKNTKKVFPNNENYENTVINVLLQSHSFFFQKDASFFLKKGLVSVNGFVLINANSVLRCGDCIQLPVSKLYLLYIKFCRRFFKKKVALFKYNSWKFFKAKIIKKKKKIKFKKRKNPKFIQAFFLFRYNTPRFLEVDYQTVTIFFLKKVDNYVCSSYYLNKLFSFKMFNLYNFKKLN